MTEGTICPKLLCHWEVIEPAEFENVFITQVLLHLEKCTELNIQLQISGPVLDHIFERYPWDRLEDPNWRGWIFDWQAAVLSKLEKNRVDHSTQASRVHGSSPLFNDPIWDLWCAFLKSWETGAAWDGKYLKGIGVHGCASTCHSPLACGKFHLVLSSHWRLIAFPWLQRYNPNLPTSGEFPFVPPEHWTNAQLHGPQNGFLDIRGNEWCWDRFHQDHWDVQLQQGGYHNVSKDGRIL